MIKHTKATSNKYYKLKNKEKILLNNDQKNYSKVNSTKEITNILEKIQKPYKYSKLSMFLTSILLFILNVSVLFNSIINSKSNLPIDYIAISLTTITLINGNLIPKLFNYFIHIFKEQYFNTFKECEDTELIEIQLWESEIQLFSYLTIFFSSFPFLYFVIGNYISQFLNLTMTFLALLVLIIFICCNFRKIQFNIFKSIFHFSRTK